MFWIGLAVGAVIGTTLGVLVMALMVAARRGDDNMDRKP